MSLYDTLVAEVSCPRCGSSVAAECEVKLGACSQRRLRVGDEVTWRPRRIVKNGGCVFRAIVIADSAAS